MYDRVICVVLAHINKQFDINGLVKMALVIELALLKNDRSRWIHVMNWEGGGCTEGTVFFSSFLILEATGISNGVAGNLSPLYTCSNNKKQDF